MRACCRTRSQNVPVKELNSFNKLLSLEENLGAPEETHWPQLDFSLKENQAPRQNSGSHGNWEGVEVKYFEAAKNAMVICFTATRN